MPDLCDLLSDGLIEAHDTIDLQSRHRFRDPAGVPA